MRLLKTSEEIISECHWISHPQDDFSTRSSKEFWKHRFKTTQSYESLWYIVYILYIAYSFLYIVTDIGGHPFEKRKEEIGRENKREGERKEKRKKKQKMENDQKIRY